MLQRRALTGERVSAVDVKKKKIEAWALNKKLEKKG